MAAYDAFISYSHAKDKPIAAALQSAVQRLGKPWYRRRALRAFRDDASLSATPALWPSIETALAQSRYLILLASPEAAASPWVTKEVAYWLDHKSADTLLIAVTDGDLGWDNAAGDFIWRDGASLPAALAGRFRSEPKWVDLRAYRAGTSTGDARFTELAADFAATIHGMPKDDLLSQEVREQRRALGLAWGAVSLLLVLATFAGWQWKLTADAERLAQLQRDRAERALAAAARTSNTLVFEVSREFRDRTGMPVELRRKILSRAQELQRELSESGDSTPVLRWSEAATLQEAVETLIALGEYKGALKSARRGLAIAEALAASDPANSDNRSLLANSHNKLADALLATGQREMALTHYQAGLSVNEALAAVDPANTRWRGDVAHNLRVIGDIQKASGRREDAVALFRKSQAIVQQLATTDPANTEWQRELAVSHDRIGDTLAASGQRKGALAEYQSLLAIVGKLVAIDPSNARWQQDLSVVRKKIGDMFLSLGSPREALAAHLQGVATSEKLVTGDPGNAEWQRQLSTGHVSVGDALAALDRREEALASYLSSLAIRKQLASAAPSSILGQHDLAALYDRMGNLLLRMERRDEALAHYRNALAISNQLVTIDPVGVEWQRNLSVSHKRVGAILFADGRLEEALVEFRRKSRNCSEAPCRRSFQYPMGTRPVR